MSAGSPVMFHSRLMAIFELPNAVQNETEEIKSNTRNAVKTCFRRHKYLNIMRSIGTGGLKKEAFSKMNIGEEAKSEGDSASSSFTSNLTQRSASKRCFRTL
jgi:hypothetical protein